MATGFQGAIFDVDGVLVDSPHERAWRDSLRELMETSGATSGTRRRRSPERFTPQVYQQVDVGQAADRAARWRRSSTSRCPTPSAASRDYGDRKQTMVIELIEAGRVHGLPRRAAVRLAVKDAGIRMAAASSSKNAGLFLRQIRLDTFAEEEGLDYDFVRPGLSLLDFFDADISGRDFAAGQAASGDLPDRCRRAGGAAGAMLRRRGRGHRHPGGQGRQHGVARTVARGRRGAPCRRRTGPRRDQSGRRRPRGAGRGPPGPQGELGAERPVERQPSSPSRWAR